ncbi:MAG TPA: hypothetical protein VFN35_20070 [Ktedonobacteraceae bacterium]|nr:hypothetical protein [Ktedonobacteraceae bacterium]
MFTKKNAKIEEQAMQEITDEQLEQVNGGGLLGAGTGLLGSLTSTATGILSSVSVSGLQVSVAGATVSTPALATNDLISELL